MLNLSNKYMDMKYWCAARLPDVYSNSKYPSLQKPTLSSKHSGVPKDKMTSNGCWCVVSSVRCAYIIWRLKCLFCSSNSLKSVDSGKLSVNMLTDTSVYNAASFKCQILSWHPVTCCLIWLSDRSLGQIGRQALYYPLVTSLGHLFQHLNLECQVQWKRFYLLS